MRPIRMRMPLLMRPMCVHNLSASTILSTDAYVVNIRQNAIIITRFICLKRNVYICNNVLRNGYEREASSCHIHRHTIQGSGFNITYEDHLRNTVSCVLDGYFKYTIIICIEELWK